MEKSNYQMYKEAQKNFEFFGTIDTARISTIFNLPNRNTDDLRNLKDYIIILTIGRRHDGKNKEKAFIEHKKRCRLMSAIHDAVDRYL